MAVVEFREFSCEAPVGTDTAVMTVEVKPFAMVVTVVRLRDEETATGTAPKESRPSVGRAAGAVVMESGSPVGTAIVPGRVCSDSSDAVVSEPKPGRGLRVPSEAPDSVAAKVAAVCTPPRGTRGVRGEAAATADVCAPGRGTSAAAAEV